MPTARELLEQADALMRKNRGRGEGDFPILTDAVSAPPGLDVQGAPIPVLTERVEEAVVDVPPPAQPVKHTDETVALLDEDPSDWLVMDTIDPSLHSVTGDAPDTLAVVPPIKLKTAETPPPTLELDTATRFTLKAAGSDPTPPPAGSVPLPGEPAANVADDAQPPEASAAPSPPERALKAVEPLVEPRAPPSEVFVPLAALAVPIATSARPAETPDTASDERWRALAEQISMQVLQRLDLFTDTGLKDQLARHLQPIVDRASTELVGEINEQVGKLVRSYVAEAIEREIAQWRGDHR
jgi:hypothetical protein